MTAREDQPEAFVGDLLDVVSQPLERAQLLSFTGLGGSNAFASQAINRLVPGGEDDPCCGVVGHSPLRPSTQGLHECVLDRLFG
jgi:hypothetical protein